MSKLYKINNVKAYEYMINDMFTYNDDNEPFFISLDDFIDFFKIDKYYLSRLINKDLTFKYNGPENIDPEFLKDFAINKTFNNKFPMYFYVDTKRKLFEKKELSIL